MNTTYLRTGEIPNWDKLLELAERDGCDDPRYYHDYAGFLMREGVPSIDSSQESDHEAEIYLAMGYSNKDKQGRAMMIPFGGGNGNDQV